jgi:hypothetical protein
MLLEYFQTLYYPSNMVFQSVAINIEYLSIIPAIFIHCYIFLRVRLWGDYYLQRLLLS